MGVMRKFLGQMSTKQRGKLKLLKLSRTIMKLLKNIKGGNVLSFSPFLFIYFKGSRERRCCLCGSSRSCHGQLV